MSFCDIGTQNDANLALYLCSNFSSVSAISADYIFLRQLTESLKNDKPIQSYWIPWGNSNIP